MSKTRILVMLSFVLALIVIMGCGGEDTTPPTPSLEEVAVEIETALFGTGWRLISATGMDNLSDVVMTLHFREGSTLDGLSGCNSYNASYTVEGNKMEISPIMSTKKVCIDERMVGERAYLAALQETAMYSSAGNQLTLSNADGSLEMTFHLEASPALAGTSWVATGFNNGEGDVTSVIAGTEITADFSEDGKLSGNTGCNDYNMMYLVTGEIISIAPSASTQKECAEPEGVMAQEQLYLANLVSAEFYLLEDGVLTLNNPEGETAVTFIPAE